MTLQNIFTSRARSARKSPAKSGRHQVEEEKHASEACIRNGKRYLKQPSGKIHGRRIKVQKYRY